MLGNRQEAADNCGKEEVADSHAAGALGSRAQPFETSSSTSKGTEDDHWSSRTTVRSALARSYDANNFVRVRNLVSGAKGGT
jgi:hypothetical protein